MKLKEILNSGESTPEWWDLAEPVSLSDPLVVCCEEGVQIRFLSARANLHLVGAGPFRFQNFTFRNEAEEAPTFIVAEDSVVVFQDCHFLGAAGGSEESLGCAVKALGHSRIFFERCHFEGNDVHLCCLDRTVVELNHCLLQESRADGVVVLGSAAVRATELEVMDSGWSGINLSHHATLDLRDSHLAGNGCHGLELAGSASYSGSKNLFSENAQNGLMVAGSARFSCQEDQFVGNRFCGLDQSDASWGFLQNCEMSHNLSHGLQLRDCSKVDLQDCATRDNQGSGLALFDHSRARGQDFLLERNLVAGAQATDETWVHFHRSHLKANLASGVVALGRASLSLDRSRAQANGGPGLQLGGESHVVVRDCEILDNERGGIIVGDQSRVVLEQNTLAHNKFDGLALADRCQATVLENLIRANERDGVFLASRATARLLSNRSQGNRRHGVYCLHGTTPLLDSNLCSDNGAEALKVESVQPTPSEVTGEKQTESTTLALEGTAVLHLPFEPQPLEKTMLLALAKHGRLSEAALGKVARTRRVGGAMENLIDRLNRAGLPLIKHDGQGAEGTVYCLKIDTTRLRRTKGEEKNPINTQGRDIC